MPDWLMQSTNTRPPRTAFINIPYATEYEERFLALVASLSLFGLIPTAALGAAVNSYRLDRILAALSECVLSIHDLTWMGLDDVAPVTPRFNMPFEFGMAVALSRTIGNDFAIIDTVPHRLDKALSDARGLDAEIVDDSPISVFRATNNILYRDEFQPEVGHFVRVYDRLQVVANSLRTEFGYASMFHAKPFAELRKVAAAMAQAIRLEALGDLPGLLVPAPLLEPTA